ncbi:hypothetical protein [Escherichia coli]|uniref:hypothetical protein n=1 Tax=Escherichia coli TaxID=562 RepID=UPI0039A53550
MKRGLRNGVAPYIPVAFCRDAGSAGHGATEAARPERSLQARGFASGMEARQGGDSFAGSVHDSHYRFATREEREGKMSTNLIFKECRQSAAMKRVLAVYGVKR